MEGLVAFFFFVRRLLKQPIFALCKAWMRLLGATVPRSCTIVGLPSMWLMRGTLTLGERCCIESAPGLYPRGSSLPYTSFSIAKGARVDVGAGSFIACSAIAARKRITIGERVLIASGCRIFDSDGHIVDELPRFLNHPDDPQEVTIGDDVWLGIDVVVGKGVTIGKGSVIGARSVVTHDIPPGVVAAGTPAQVIRPLRLEDKA